MSYLSFEKLTCINDFWCRVANVFS